MIIGTSFLNKMIDSKRIRAIGTLIGLVSVVFLCPTSSYAQVPDTATTIADPSRQEEQLQIEEGILTLSDHVKVEQTSLQNAPDGAENIKFELKTLNVDGFTVYSEEEVASFYNEMLGKTISLVDIYGVSTALTNKYRNDGYILTQVVVPPQTIDDGKVNLRVVEGFINEITVDGEDITNEEGETEEEGSLNFIRNYVNSVELSKPLNIEELEHYLLIIGDLPGIEARSILSPSTIIGAADLRIIVSRTPYEAYLSVDNYGSRYIGPLEFTASGTANSFFGNNEVITLNFVGAPDPGTDANADLELAHYSVGYRQPVPYLGQGTTVELYASYTDTEPGYDLKEYEVEGNSRYVSAKVVHPIIRSRLTNLSAYTLFDVRNVSSSNNLQDTLNDHIRTLRAGTDYQFVDELLGFGISAFNVEISKGLNVLGATRSGDANITRTKGDPTFTKLTGNMQRLQRVSSHVNVLVAAKGQWSSAPLLSAEEFGVGGSDIGRGYDSSEIVGDEGVAGKVEIQWNNPRETELCKSYQLFGFYDAGRVWNKDATTSSQKRDSLTSTGFGLRAEFEDDIKADLTVALPLSRDVQTRGDQSVTVLFKLSRSF